MSKYQYVVVPKNAHTNEVIAAELARTTAIAGSEITFLFQEKQKSGYEVKHEFITRLKNFGDPRMKYELYERVNMLEFRKYSIPGKKTSKKVKEAKKRLEELKTKKNGS